MENSELNRKNSNDNWQVNENADSKAISESPAVDLKSAEASGYGTDESLFAANFSEDDDDEKDEEDDHENHKTDWGSVDPLSDTDGLPNGNEPSGPGSAV